MGMVNGTWAYNASEVRGMLYYALRLYNEVKGTKKNLLDLSVAQQQALLRSVQVDEVLYRNKNGDGILTVSLVRTIERQRRFHENNPPNVFNLVVGVRSDGSSDKVHRE